MALHRDRQQQLQYASILPSTLLVLALLACGETPQQPAAASPPIPPPRLLVEVAENDDGWDYYNADVTIIREAGYNGAGMYTPESQSAYNIEQRLQLGTWNMRVQAAAHDPTGDGTMAPGEVDASRVETDDNVAYLRLFDRNGSALTTTPPPMQSYVGNPLPPYGDTVPAFPSPHRGARRSEPARRLPAGHSSPGWVRWHPRRSPRRTVSVPRAAAVDATGSTRSW